APAPAPRSRRVLFLALLLALAGAAWFLARGTFDRGLSAPSGTARAIDDPVAAPEDAPRPDPASSTASGSAAAAETPRLAIADEPAARRADDAAARGAITGLVVDEAGRPVADAIVGAVPDAQDGRSAIDWARFGKESPDPSTKTAADGSFRLPLG